MALVSDTGSSATDRITSNPAVTGLGQANTVVTIKEGGTILGTAMADATGAWSFTPSGLADGAHTLTASQTDLAGNTGTATLSFTLDRTAPAVSMALVSDTGSSSTDKITSNPAVRGHRSGQYRRHDQGGRHHPRHRDGRRPGAWSFTPSGLADGAHTLTASQTDLAGNIGTATLGLTLDKTAPVLSVVPVADTGSSATDRITSNPAIKGVGEANTVVTIKEGAAILGTTMADATGAWSFTPTGLVDGVHTLSATQTDTAGNTRTTSLSLTLDRTAPTLSIAVASDAGVIDRQYHVDPEDHRGRRGQHLSHHQGRRHHARHRDGQQHGGVEPHTDRLSGRRRAHAHREPDRPRRQHRDGDVELNARQGCAATVAKRRNCRFASAKRQRASREKRIRHIWPGFRTGRDNAWR